MVEDTKHLNAVTVFLLFQWRRESRRKEGQFHYQPTCRLMPHGFTQPTVVMVATCHVICVSPWMNGDLRDTCPPPGSMHRGRSGSASAQRAAGDTPTATCLTVCVPVCVCVYAYVFAFLEEDKQSWLPQDHCCHRRDDNNGNNNISSRSPRPAARRSDDCPYPCVWCSVKGALCSLTEGIQTRLWGNNTDNYCLKSGGVRQM